MHTWFNIRAYVLPYHSLQIADLPAFVKELDNDDQGRQQICRRKVCAHILDKAYLPARYNVQLVGMPVDGR